MLPYPVIFRLQVRTVKIRHIVFPLLKKQANQLPRRDIFVIKPLGDCHSIYQLPLVCRFGFSAAFIAALFVYHKKDARQVFQRHFLGRCLGTQTVSLKRGAVATFV